MTAQEYKKAMREWCKVITAWQLANPDKNWLTELCNSQPQADSGGSNPPPPPPPPPGT